jgi:hypothetical protein
VAGTVIHCKKKVKAQLNASNSVARPFVEHVTDGQTDRGLLPSDGQTNQRKVDIGPPPPAYHDDWTEPSGIGEQCQVV